jgi:GAF domain-containing protein
VLLGDGRLFGTLCAIDPDTHVSSPEDIGLLRLLAQVVAFHLESAERSRLEGALLAARTAQHEANGWLASAVGYAELLAANPALPEALLGIARECEHSGRRAAEVLNRLASVERLQTTDWGPNLEPTIDLDRSTGSDEAVPDGRTAPVIRGSSGRRSRGPAPRPGP